MKKERENKKRAAVALSYKENVDSEPKVVAKGKGSVAEHIIQKAKENKIPIQEDGSLVELLSELKLKEGIPQELYQVIAEIFAFVYNIDKNLKK
ncbi:EscU/YscU/HrcU family type III secretion system export apparatus switch protein [Bacillus nitroreducens]